MTTTPVPSDRARRRLVWAVPVVVTGVVAGVVALSGSTASGSSPKLPHRSAAQLLAEVQTSSTTALSGSISETAKLGIPALPGGDSNASFSWQTFLSGSHAARVWVDGAARQRVALVGELSEADVIHNGPDLWTYTSGTNTVTHSTLPAPKARAETPSATDGTPMGVATRVLKAVSPTTSVTVDSAQRVAGRDAYTLVLAPRDARSTVRKVTISIDATKHVPLRVQIFGSASTPAFSIGFSSISYARPASSIFAFTAPKGATTSTDPLGLRGRQGRHTRHGSPAGDSPAAGSTPARPVVLGSGWTSVIELRDGTGTIVNGSMLHDLTSAGTGGARLLHTALINAVILPDGRAFVGAVSPSLLEHVAASTPN